MPPHSHIKDINTMKILSLFLASQSLLVVVCDALLLVPPSKHTTTALSTGWLREKSRAPSCHHHRYHDASLLSCRKRSSSRLFVSSSSNIGGGAPNTPPPPQQQQHQQDPASTLPQLMNSLWGLISFASTNMQKGQSATILYPGMSSQLSNPNFVSKLMAHLDACKDVCDNFGVNTVLVPFWGSGDGNNNRIVQGFTVKSYRNPHITAGTFSSLQFAPDPFWDDEEEWDFSEADDEDGYYDDFAAAAGASGGEKLPQIENLIPKEDSVIIDLSKKWVDKMMADLALCPFTKSSDMSGIPMGPVRYHIDRVTTMEDAYKAYWSEVCTIESVDQSTISTTLHILPEFCMNSVELFEQWADTLTGTLEALSVEELLQLIFFHPQWTFRDGGDRSGMGGLAANYARRSPWPMVNILRTPQVRTAQRGIPTGLVYQQNEKTLGKIGTTQLEKMLRLRDWSDIEGMKVDRKDMEALRVANDLQVTGVVKDEDKSFAFDSTPAANKVDRSLIEGGDMVNIIQQALEIRLGKKESSASSSSSSRRLDGAQTSAAMMASDFLLEELNAIATEYPGDQRAPVLDIRDDLDGTLGNSSGSSRPSSAMAKGGYAAAYGFDLNDEDDGAGEEAEVSAMWGGGISMTSDD